MRIERLRAGEGQRWRRMVTLEYDIVRLTDAPEHADLVTRWLLEEWPDPELPFRARKSRLSPAPDCPRTLLAVSNAGPCGVIAFARFMRAGDVKPSLFVDALYVSQAVRGQGVGSALLDAAVAASTGFANVLFAYTGSVAWYQRRGWFIVEAEDADCHAVLGRTLTT